MTQSAQQRQQQRWIELAERADAPSRDIGAALHALSDDDLLRLRALARLRARALPPGGVTWSDLLHEAVLRALEGTRRWPPGVPLLAFLSGIMRSLCDEQWRRRRREGPAPGEVEAAAMPTAAATAADDADPERAYAAAQALAAVNRLFACDAVALKVIAGLANGMGAEEIQSRYGLSAVEYDTARRRMRRALLRQGLAWAWP